MAAARFIFNRIQKSIGSLLVDAFTSERHQRKNTITKYPVEDGIQLSDHMITDPDILAVTGIIEPILDGSNLATAYKTLKDIRTNKELVTIVTGLQVYENMGMTTFNISRNANNGGSLEFTATFQEVEIVRSQTVDISVSQINDVDQESYEQAQPEVDVGKATDGQNVESSYKDQLKQYEEEFNELIGDPIFGPEE